MTVECYEFLQVAICELHVPLSSTTLIYLLSKIQGDSKFIRDPLEKDWVRSRFTWVQWVKAVGESSRVIRLFPSRVLGFVSTTERDDTTEKD